MKYRPDIDGLRAVAVLPVVFYHAGFGLFAGGFVGVDVFFVISGYLITSLIYAEIKAGTFTYRNFYLRRVRRLFPALFAVVLASVVPAYFLLLPEELEDFGQSVASLTLFSSNILFWSEAGYFAPTAELKPLLHTWSLAIEEQYYLLFPVFLLLLKRTPSQPFLLATAALFIASLGFSAITVYSAPDAAFYLLPSRTWELLLGSLIAMAGLQFANRFTNETLAVVGLCFIGFAIFNYDEQMAFPGLAALLPCLGTGLLIVSGSNHTTVVSRVLSDKRIVFFGLISYSLYLWHWPIFVYAKHYLVGPLPTDVALGLTCLAVVVSVLSWRFIEKPFRGPGAWLPSTRLFQGAAGMMVLLIGIGLLLDESEGLPGRMPAQVIEILAVAEERPANRRRCEGIEPTELNLTQLCSINALAQPPSVFLWGDSHANMFVPALGEAAFKGGRSGVYAVANGCVPLLGVSLAIQNTDLDCKAFNTAVFELIRQNQNLHTIVLAARWGLHANGVPYPGAPGRPSFLRNNDAAALSIVENQRIFGAAFRTTVETLTALGREVIVVGPVPETIQDVPAAMAKLAWRALPERPGVPLADFLLRQASVFTSFESLATTHQLTILPVHEAFCDDNSCKLEENGEPLYRDDNHLTSKGIVKITPNFYPAFNNR